jgi:Transposase DDE domain
MSAMNVHSSRKISHNFLHLKSAASSRVGDPTNGCRASPSSILTDSVPVELQRYHDSRTFRLGARPLDSFSWVLRLPSQATDVGVSPESGARGGYDGAKRRKGSKVHAACVDTLGHLPALHVTAANEQDRAQVEKLADHRCCENISLFWARVS